MGSCPRFLSPVFSVLDPTGGLEAGLGDKVESACEEFQDSGILG